MEQVSPESKDRPKQINSSAQLASHLGYIRNPEGSQRGVRMFTKPLGVYEIPLPSRQTSKAFSTLLFSDQGRAAGRTIEERIYVGVEIPLARAWEFILDIRRFADDPRYRDRFQAMGLTIGEYGDFDKNGLKNGGYQRFAEFLQEIEKEGFYEQQLSSMLQRIKARFRSSPT